MSKRLEAYRQGYWEKTQKQFVRLALPTRSDCNSLVVCVYGVLFRSSEGHGKKKQRTTKNVCSSDWQHNTPLCAGPLFKGGKKRKKRVLSLVIFLYKYKRRPRPAVQLLS
ncbi:Uncharacterized protein APZ42_027694 [Daphnia magna]|uniref:Uncharacterized protein n=1 Tax=Daphnia magna TaxID=35525 RepID=A0A164R7C0_9CRUS|nr:Uncharacterized protein APZ42_027694 [Daphnia magna]